MKKVTITVTHTRADCSCSCAHGDALHEDNITVTDNTSYPTDTQFFSGEGMIEDSEFEVRSRTTYWKAVGYTVEVERKTR